MTTTLHILKRLPIQAQRFSVVYGDQPNTYTYNAIRIETQTWETDKETTPIWFFIVSGGVVHQANTKEHNILEAEFRQRTEQ